MVSFVGWRIFMSFASIFMPAGTFVCGAWFKNVEYELRVSVVSKGFACLSKTLW